VKGTSIMLVAGGVAALGYVAWRVLHGEPLLPFGGGDQSTVQSADGAGGDAGGPAGPSSGGATTVQAQAGAPPVGRGYAVAPGAAAGKAPPPRSSVSNPGGRYTFPGLADAVSEAGAPSSSSAAGTFTAATTTQRISGSLAPQGDSEVTPRVGRRSSTVATSSAGSPPASTDARSGPPSTRPPYGGSVVLQLS